MPNRTFCAMLGIAQFSPVPFIKDASDMRPTIDDLQDGKLRVRMKSRHIDATIREHSFEGIDIPPALQKLLNTVQCIVFSLEGNVDLSSPVMAEERMFSFGGFRNCRLSITLAPEHVDALRENGCVCLEIPPDQRPRVAKVNCLDVTLIAETTAALSLK